MDVICKICNKEFNSEDALKDHNKSKHFEAKKELVSKSAKKRVKNWGIFILVLAILIFGIYWLSSRSVPYADVPAKEINIGSHSNIALHIHSDLEIIIDGEQSIIPGSIGISSGVMRPIHTHDSSGEVHIEGPYQRDFTIGEFFDIWGRAFNSTCIFEYCTDSGELKMFVNGKESSAFQNYIFRDG